MSGRTGKIPENLTAENNETTSVSISQPSPQLNQLRNQSNSASSTKTRQEKDAERKRLKRANETPEERAKRNEKKRLDTRIKRSLESSDALSERLNKQQAVDKARRSNETAEQHRLRLDQQQEIDSVRRSNETAEQRRLRLDQQQDIDQVRRSNETAEQRRLRLDQQQDIDQVRRSEETAEQHRFRLDQQQEIDSVRRSTETAEQHRLRLDQQQDIDQVRRSEETAEQHRSRLDQQQTIDKARISNESAERRQSRLNQQQVNNITRRGNETSAERSARIRSDSQRRQQRMLEERNNPTVKIWPAAVSKKVKENCLREFNKTMSMNSLREQICVVCNSRHSEKGMHNLLLSDINDALLKPKESLYEMIPELRSRHSQDTELDEEAVVFNNAGFHKHSSLNNSTYLISHNRLLYRDGLLEEGSHSNADCRMCHECWLAISKGKISKFSPANGMWIGDVPDHLKGLTIPEQKLISLYRHNSCIIKLHSPWHSPNTAQPALKGNCITFPQNLSNIATSLPLSPNELSESIKIIFIGSSKPARHHLRKILSVRRQRVLDALVWLKENNVLYSHISLDKHIIASLPDDDVPESIWETLDYISDDQNANAEREGYTEDPLTCERVMSEQTTNDFIPINPSGVLDVNGASVSMEDINQQLLHKLRIDTNKQSTDSAETNTDDDLVHLIPRGGVPMNEYNNPTLLLGLYPTLFPYGTGLFEDTSRSVKISFKKQIQYLLSYNDRRFEEHHSFIFIVFNMLQRREACLHARLMTSKPFFNKTAEKIVSLNADDIKQVLNGLEKNKTSAFSANPQVNALLSQVKAVGGKVMGSAHSRSVLRNQIHGLIFNQGLPSIFLTINPADINSRVALYFAGVNLDLDAIIPNNLPSTYGRAEIIASHPIATAKFFHKLITTVLETMIAGEKVLGPVKAYFGTVESQGRGSLHLHMLIWLDHKYSPAQLRENIKDEQFRNNLRDYLEDIISEDLDHL